MPKHFKDRQENPQVLTRFTQDSIIRRFYFPYATLFNRVLETLPPKIRKKYVPRDEFTYNDQGREIRLQMFTNVPAPARPATVHEKVLGQKYLDLLELRASDNCPESEALLDRAIEEAYEEALEEVEDYNLRYGPADDETDITLTSTRPWVIGDHVQFFHKPDPIDIHDLEFDEFREERLHEEFIHPRDKIQSYDSLGFYEGEATLKLDEDTLFLKKRSEPFVKEDPEPKYQMVPKGSWWDVPWSWFDPPAEPKNTKGKRDITKLFETWSPEKKARALKDGLTQEEIVEILAQERG